MLRVKGHGEKKMVQIPGRRYTRDTAVWSMEEEGGACLLRQEASLLSVGPQFTGSPGSQHPSVSLVLTRTTLPADKGTLVTNYGESHWLLIFANSSFPWNLPPTQKPDNY